MNKKSFFSVLFSVCSGTSLFHEIAQFRPLKGLWQLLMLVFLASLAYSFTVYPSLKKNIESGCAYMQKNFGNIIVEDNGVFPEIDRKKPKSIEYFYIKVDYLPDTESLNNFKFDPGTNLSGFIWTPFKAIGWLKLNQNQIVVYPAVSNQYDTRFLSIFTNDQFPNYIKYSDKLEIFKNLMFRVCLQSQNPIVGAGLLKESNSFSDFVSVFALWSSFIVFFKFLISAYFNVIFYAIIFAAIYSFTEKGGVLNYKFKNFFVIAVYAAFPAIIIGTIFESIQSHYIDYSTVFIIAFIIYLFAVTNKLKEKGNKTNA